MAQVGSFRCFVHGCCVQAFAQCSKESRLFQSTRLTKFVKSLREPTDVRVRVSTSPCWDRGCVSTWPPGTWRSQPRAYNAHYAWHVQRTRHERVMRVAISRVRRLRFSHISLRWFGWCCDHTEFQLRFHSEGGYSFPSPLNVTFCRRRTVLLKGAKVNCFSMAHSSGCFDASG